MPRTLHSTILFIVLAIHATLTACATVPASTAPTEPRITFHGTVTRDQDFERELQPGLVFRLINYDRNGEVWSIWVGDTTQPDKNFVQCVTSPSHGPNALEIAGGRPDDTAKKFLFVLNETDYQAACDTLEKLAYSYSYTEEEAEQAQQAYGKLPMASGVLTITEVQLGNLARNGQAYIESMSFEVSVNLSSTDEERCAVADVFCNLGQPNTSSRPLRGCFATDPNRAGAGSGAAPRPRACARNSRFRIRRISPIRPPLSPSEIPCGHDVLRDQPYRWAALPKWCSTVIPKRVTVLREAVLD